MHMPRPLYATKEGGAIIPFIALFIKMLHVKRNGIFFLGQRAAHDSPCSFRVAAQNEIETRLLLRMVRQIVHHSIRIERSSWREAFVEKDSRRCGTKFDCSPNGGRGKKMITEHAYALCDGLFASQTALKDHEGVKHPPRPATRNDVPPLPGRKGTSSEHACTLCGTLFKLQAALMEHVRAKHGASVAASAASLRRHSCGMCGKSFETESALWNHEDAKGHYHHRMEGCELCNRLFKSSSALDEHVRAKHGNAGALAGHLCGTCGKSFENRSSVVGSRGCEGSLSSGML